MKLLKLALIGLILAGVAFIATACLDEPDTVTVTVSNESELETAIANAEAGDLIEMESGDYGTPGNVSIGGYPFMRYPNSWETNVWVRPAEDAEVKIAWRSDTPNLTLAGVDLDDLSDTEGRELHVTIAYLQDDADENEILGVDLLEGAYVRGADDVIFAGNRIRCAEPNLETDWDDVCLPDGIQIAGGPLGSDPAENVQIHYNTIGPWYRDPRPGLPSSQQHHADCIQTFSSLGGSIDGMVIANNTLYPCASGNIQLGGQDIGDVEIKDNVMWGCGSGVGSELDTPWCPATGGGINGGSRSEINIEGNTFHSGTNIGLNIEFSGDEWTEDGDDNVYTSNSWPYLGTMGP